MKKTLLSCLAVAGTSLAALALGGCSDQLVVTIWVAEEIQALTQEEVNTWVEANGETYGVDISNFSVQTNGEDGAPAEVLSDPTIVDIFCFAQDALSRLVAGGVLSQITGDYLTAVEENNDAGSVSAGSVGDAVYAFPLTADNGYFMYYDQDFVDSWDTEHPEDPIDLDSLESILSACSSTGRYFCFNGTNGWYTPAFFFGTGCVSEWETDENSNFTGYTDTINSDAGLVALNGLYNLVHNYSAIYYDEDDSTIGFSDNANDNGAAFAIDGTWHYATNAELVDNLGCTDLPSFTGTDGVSYHLGSFSGNKLMGITPQTDETKSAICYSLANYLTDYDCQMDRFTANAWGPSNVDAQASEEVQANPGLAALALQSEYSVPQGNYPNGWWDIMAALASPEDFQSVEDGTLTLADMLTTYETAISALI